MCRPPRVSGPRVELHKTAKRIGNIPEDMVLAASFDAMGRERGETAGCAFDVRLFDDPDAGNLRDHCGTHPEILKRFVLHRLFPQLLQAVRHRLRLLSHHHETVRCVFYCNKGKHRSVAAATVFGPCVDVDDLLRNGGCYHITPLQDKCRCRWCGECRDGPKSAEGGEAITCAVRMWRTLR